MRREVWVSRITTLLLFVAASVVAILFVKQMVGWFMFINSAMVIFLLPLAFFRFFWWRFNVWGELAAIVLGLPLSIIVWFVLDFQNTDAHPMWHGLGLLFGLSFVVLIAVTLVTPPESSETLKRFYERCRPPGFWGPVRASMDVSSVEVPSTRSLFVSSVLGILACLNLVLATNALFVSGWPTIATYFLFTIGFSAALIVRVLKNPSPVGAISRRSRRGEFGRLQPRKIVCLCSPFPVMENQQIIDAHVMLGEEHPLALLPDDLLRRMDSHGIDRAIARPMGAELVVGNQAGNNRVLKCGPRICGLVSVNPWYGPRAIDELKRCQQAGAVGLFLHPSRQGFMPTEPIADAGIGICRRGPMARHVSHGHLHLFRRIGRRRSRASLSANAIHPGLRRLRRHVVRNSWRDGRRAQSLAGNVAHVGRRDSRHTQGCRPAASYFRQRRAEQLLCIALKCLENLDFDADTKAAVLRENARRLFRLT